MKYSINLKLSKISPEANIILTKLCKYLHNNSVCASKYLNIETSYNEQIPNFFYTSNPFYQEISLMEWYLTIYKDPKWFIILPSNEQMQEVGEWFNKNYVRDSKYNLDYSKVNYLNTVNHIKSAAANLGLVYGKGRDNSLFWEFQIKDLKKDGFIQITYEEFKKYIKKENMKEKKIIGYKAPYDLFQGNIKKGTIYTFLALEKSVYKYSPKENKYFSLPREIVETWEPVYESTEKELILKSGKKLIIRQEGVDTGNRIIKIEELKEIVWAGVPNANSNNNNKIAGFNYYIQEISWKIGCVDVLNSELKEIINIHKSL